MIVKVLNEATLGQAVDKAADAINAEVVDANSGQGIIERELDRALVVNLRKNKRGEGDFTNILFIGEAGTGKTSRIRAWAIKNNINLVEVRAAGMDDTDLGGAMAPDKNGEVVNRLASTEFDELNEPRSVLFLDEFNRAPASVRTNLLELVNSHVVPDPRVKGKQRKLEGFLFTVAAINPAVAGYNTDELDKAEKSRFKKVNVPAEKSNLLWWLKNRYENILKKPETDEDEKKEIAGKIGLATKLLNSKEFTLDTSEEADAVEGEDSPLNNRTFTLLLDYCDGTKKDFIDNWSNFCNPAKKKKVELILKDYKDVDDKASQLLNQHKTEADIFKKNTNLYDAMMNEINN